MPKNVKILSLDKPQVSLDALLSALKVGHDDEDIELIKRMLGEALSIAKPAAMYAAYEPEISNGIIYINGTCFDWPFVYEKLHSQRTVVPYVATCGVAVDGWSKAYTGIFDQFIADTIKYLLLGQIMEVLHKETALLYDPKKSASSINPGSLEVWPINGQGPLFKALGGVTDDIGVRLEESFLMVPNKSVSGIFFETEEHYDNCMLCPRENCPNRRAEYAPMWC